jgi:small subunit ribosomal protein S16
MPVKIRLQRHGKKGKPFYWVVAADSRAKRDGRYLEKIGTYNPNTNPATIDIKVDRAVDWLQNGAQPTDTARNLLSETGALLKNHLVNGVRKGAHSEEEVEAKFAAWVADKVSRQEVAKDKVAKAKADEKAKALAAEKELNEKRKADAEAAAAEAAAAEAAAEAPSEEAAEAPSEEAAEAPVEEVVSEEAPTEEDVEENVSEASSEEAAEAPVEEVVSEEAPTEETVEENASETPGEEATGDKNPAEAAE